MTDFFDVAHLRRLRVLLRLAEAHVEAQAVRQNDWAYAVPIDVLRNHVGVTDHDLQELVCQGLVEHGVETSRRRAGKRTFRRGARLKLTGPTCFVLTAAGAHLVRRLCEADQPAPVSIDEKPRWNAETGDWTWRGKLVKQLRAVADTQRPLLDACEARGWVNPIRNPWADLPPHQRSRRLRRALDRLKSGQREAQIGSSCFDKARSFHWFPRVLRPAKDAAPLRAPGRTEAQKNAAEC